MGTASIPSGKVSAHVEAIGSVCFPEGNLLLSTSFLYFQIFSKNNLYSYIFFYFFLFLIILCTLSKFSFNTIPENE